MSDKYTKRGKPKLAEIEQPLIPVVSQNATTEKKNKTYVVTRNGIPVNENEYDSLHSATQELNRWEKILEKWPDRSKLEIIEKI